LQAITALSHFNTESSVGTLLAATTLPMDYYRHYALQESFKQLKPVWMAMFRKNKKFLSDDPVKAGYLLSPLSSDDLQKESYFTMDDPESKKYDRSPLSREDFADLSNAPAVTQFLAMRKSSRVDSSAQAVISGKTVIHLSTLPAKMLFDKTSFSVKAGEEVSIIFKNEDDMAHNVVICKPKTQEIVGKAADAMAATKDGYERNFIPSIAEVLFATPLVSAGEQFRLDFKAPDPPGDYPFICSFPGHWQFMKGNMTVIKP
ncbi:MAG TPA: plastocyanin/azurin family copper-binding protein, partial [Chryseolinea sp.]|nr:plastocyanin/azurin family copper-binding protein [Chryseolinea sp.]